MCAACNGSTEQAGKGQLSDGACRPSSPLHLHRCSGTGTHHLHREHGTASQEHLVNTCVHITNKGREGRNSGQAFFHQSNPINQITRDSMQGLWHLMETPTFTTRHICTENPPKTSILWMTVSSSIGKIFLYIVITFLNIHAYRLVSFFLSFTHGK